MPDRTIISVFAKPPVAGSAKTRLASRIGSARAATLAQAFLLDTWATVSALTWARVILATTDNRFRDFRLPSTPEIWLQGEGDLGQRIERVVKRGLAEVDAVIAIGADTPGLPPRLLEQAREELTLKDAVLGPSEDGGFYLIGLRRCPERLFEGLPWSSPDTFAAMKARLESVGMSVGVLDRWFDVDEVEDLDRLRSEISQGHIDAPATNALLTASPQAVRISVVVPVLNEEREIGGQLESLRSIEGLHEVVVVDGGSTDGTLAILRSFDGVRVVTSTSGRAIQMNAGARVASGEALLFLHADVRLPKDAAKYIRGALAKDEIVAGAFRTWTVATDRRTWLGPLLHLADVRSRYSRLPYGDQALFVRAHAFRTVGGFPEMPLMEDLELSRRLSDVGGICTVPASVQVSGRRFSARPVYYTFLVNVFPLLYRMGIPPRVLANLYGNPR